MLERSFSNHTCLRILRIRAHRMNRSFLRIWAHRSIFLRIRLRTYLRFRSHRSLHNHRTCRIKSLLAFKKLTLIKIRTFYDHHSRSFSCIRHHSVGRIRGCKNHCRSSYAVYPFRHSDHKV